MGLFKSAVFFAYAMIILLVVYIIFQTLSSYALVNDFIALTVNARTATADSDVVKTQNAIETATSAQITQEYWATATEVENARLIANATETEQAHAQETLDAQAATDLQNAANAVETQEALGTIGARESATALSIQQTQESIHSTETQFFVLSLTPPTLTPTPTFTNTPTPTLTPSNTPLPTCNMNLSRGDTPAYTRPSRAASFIRLPENSQVRLFANIQNSDFAYVQYEDTFYWMAKSQLSAVNEIQCANIVSWSIGDSYTQIAFSDEILFSDTFANFSVDWQLSPAVESRFQTTNNIPEFLIRSTALDTPVVISNSSVRASRSVQDSQVALSFRIINGSRDSYIGVRFRVDDSMSNYYEVQLMTSTCIINLYQVAEQQYTLLQSRPSNLTNCGSNSSPTSTVEGLLEVSFIGNQLVVSVNDQAEVFTGDLQDIASITSGKVMFVLNDADLYLRTIVGVGE